MWRTSSTVTQLQIKTKTSSTRPNFVFLTTAISKKPRTRATTLTLVYLVTTIYFFILVVRVLYSLVGAFVRDWRPRGLNLIIAELVMTLTDPPLRFFRRFIPPLRLGQVSLDLSFIVVFFIVMIIRLIAFQGAT